jgi:hypothetical protein
MHDCKLTRARFTEVALDGADARSDEILSAQLRSCPACTEEFATLKKDLRTASALIEKTMPPEKYWIGYHERLRQKLTDFRVDQLEAQVLFPPTPIRQPMSKLKKVLMSSIPVPVPVFVTFILGFAIFFMFGANAGQPVASTPTFATVPMPVVIPTVEERVVTRVVYRDRRRPIVSKKTNQGPHVPAGGISVAASSAAEKETPEGLIGFKPLDEIKLTVIKGGYQDEK